MPSSITGKMQQGTHAAHLSQVGKQWHKTAYSTHMRSELEPLTLYIIIWSKLTKGFNQNYCCVVTNMIVLTCCYYLTRDQANSYLACVYSTVLTTGRQFQTERLIGQRAPEDWRWSIWLRSHYVTAFLQGIGSLEIRFY